MRSAMRYLKLSLLAVVVATVVCSAVARAANFQPLVTYSVASYDELMADLKYVGQIAGNPRLADGLEGLITFATQGKGLVGLDKSRSWGAVIEIDADAADQLLTNPQAAVRALVFLPVTDLKAFLGALQGMIGTAEDVGDGVFKIGQEGQPPGFVKQVGAWAFVATSPSMLSAVPDDPTNLTAELADNYDVALRVNVANLPKQFRDAVLFQINQAAQPQMLRRPGDSPLEFALRRLALQGMSTTVRSILEELEHVTIGFCLDHNTGQTYADVVVTAKSGTKAAANFAAMTETTTSFAGIFQPDGVLASRCSGNISQQYAAQLKRVASAVRTKAMERIDSRQQPEAQAKLAKEMLGLIMDSVEETLGRGRFDMALSVLAAPDALTLMAGASVAQSAKLESVAVKLAQLAGAENPALAKMIQLNADKVGQVNFHKLSVPIPPTTRDREKAVQLFGETVEVVVGFGPEGVYLAAGRDAAGRLKQAIEQSSAQKSQTVPPMQVSVDLGNLAKFVSEMGDEETSVPAGMLAAMLAPAGEKDHITLVASAVPNGMRLRLELEEGILKAIGAMTQALGAQPGNP